MNFPRVISLFGVAACSLLAARATYAPLPTTDTGKDFTVSLTAGVSRDTNLFGAPSGEIASTVYRFAPKAAYAGSISDQTFVSASYQITADYFDNRPGEKTLFSHDVGARLAHAFSPVTNLSFNETFTVAKNPESLLAGVPLNTDQSFQRNQLDAIFATAPTKKAGVVLKARSVYYDYRSAPLGRSLDRLENLVGASGDYALLPETKIVGEYRHQEVAYRSLSDNKDKHSDFLLLGTDYTAGPKLSADARIGVEFRRRAGERSTTAPYAELAGKYDFGENAFVSAGYVYTLEEASDVVRFTDTQVSRFFVNLQHPLTARVVASGSFTYEPSQLQGRRGFSDLDEETTRLGGAVTYVAAKNWTAAVTYDYDHIASDDTSRRQVRHRYGVSATFAF